MISVARRRFVCALGVSAVASHAGVRAAQTATAPETRTLAFDNLHTGEKMVVEYYARGVYEPQALTSVNHLLRDFRTGDVGTIDVALLDLLHRLAALTASQRPFQIISGYRSPATNNAPPTQHRRGQGQPSHAWAGHRHPIGGRASAVIARGRAAMRRGGVGYYPASDFVHVDTGRVRAW